ncbi:phosphoribosylanthranilate isomerase [Mobilitalea sibirica]|uniref:N-(5'-phosphoribosyl)anthranilate isomerase n=1 Tax=Mobilitalea sibirica TaxID=1462919 RepID=A0A8J7H090_9FIRM|nr:phosphoribosylanthranilate isomerase [Mobilitalea sibirica]MBH1941754.1 phosphoribosylanthranilate isomerase [Mobilitalea sibirica]
MTKIKICGLTQKTDIEAVNEVLPDYIGFVFAESKRQVSDEQARQLKLLLNPTIQSVGVFVNEDIKRIEHLCKMGILDLVQLHGDEDDEYMRKLRKLIPNPIIKAIRIGDGRNMDVEKQTMADYTLLDTYKKDLYGGSGEVFNWNLIKDVGKPFFLAGGIHEGNIMNAVIKCRPYCIDVSSGVETNGLKDPDKIKAIVTKIRSVR